jgi:serine/threonine protein kinase
MPLSPKTLLGPYEILSPLGAGGMGEVYRARDTRLRRVVALKVLPNHLSPSPEDRARLQREARAIAALNHPHICTLHDVGRDGDTDYLVMELVDGETLARVLTRGALPLQEFLKFGIQMADALDRAHRAGVIHRDLKPGNIMVTSSGVKILDFGLASTARRAAHAGEATAVMLTDSQESVGEGNTAGTLLYMSPEQLEGKGVDIRSDLWALGCVLYEMATGKAAFEASSHAGIVSMIMKGQPRKMSEIATSFPPALERVVMQCLAKDPYDRWQTTGDLKRELEWIGASDTRSKGVDSRIANRSSHTWQTLVILAVSGLLATYLAAMLLRPKPSSTPVVFELSPAAQTSIGGTGTHADLGLPRISPNGKTIAFNATDTTGASAIWVRGLSSLETRRLPGTEGASRPFWSPDSRSIGFFVGGRLMKLDLNGGNPIKVCEVRNTGDGTWSRGGAILFDGAFEDSIRMVRVSDGMLTSIRRGSAHAGTAWPQFLPDGRHYLYLGLPSGMENGSLMAASIDGEEPRAIGPAASRVEYSSGHLLYVREGTLFAHAFDPAKIKFTAAPVPLAQNVMADRAGLAQFSTSSEGTLVYHSGYSAGTTSLVWLDRFGRRLGVVGAPGNYDQPALSPDGTQLAVTVGDPLRSKTRIWIWDLNRNIGRPLSDGEQDASDPVWSPDGTRVLFDRWTRLLTHSVHAGSRDSLLYYSVGERKTVGAWSADGRWIVYSGYSVPGSDANADIFALSMGEKPFRSPVITTQHWDVHPALAPDGNWLAYASHESGEWEIYVQSFRGRSGKWRLSTGGGVQPVWRNDGKELFFLSLDGDLMSVNVDLSQPHFSLPQRLFKAPTKTRLSTRNQYAAMGDGQKFLFVAPEAKETMGTTKVVLNWPAMLPK